MATEHHEIRGGWIDFLCWSMKLLTHHESVLYNHHTQYTMLKQNAIDCNNGCRQRNKSLTGWELAKFEWASQKYVYVPHALITI